MAEQILLALIGLCAGGIVAGGMIGLLIGLGIIPRFAGLTHTGERISLYEDSTLLGGVFGSCFWLFVWEIPVGELGLLIFGAFSGIFLGSWILSLAEMADIFPIVARRIKLKQGMPWIIISVAIGKTVGALLYFYKGW